MLAKSIFVLSSKTLGRDETPSNLPSYVVKLAWNALSVWPSVGWKIPKTFLGIHHTKYTVVTVGCRQDNGLGYNSRATKFNFDEI